VYFKFSNFNHILINHPFISVKMITNKVFKFVKVYLKFGFLLNAVSFELVFKSAKLYSHFHSTAFQYLNALSWIGEISIICSLTYDVLFNPKSASCIVFNILFICIHLLFVGGHVVVVGLEAKLVSVFNSKLVLNTKLGKLNDKCQCHL